MDKKDSPELDSTATANTVADTSATENKEAVKTESEAKSEVTASAKDESTKSTKSAKPAAKSAKATKEKDSKSAAKKPSGAKKSAAKAADDTTAEGKGEKRPARKVAKSSSKSTKSQAKVQKFRIRLTCFDHVLIDESTSNIVNTVKRTGANVCGPVPLPVRRHRYDLLRSPHKDKRSREQIEIREHCRLLDIVDISNKATSALANLDLPPGVHADIKVMKV